MDQITPLWQHQQDTLDRAKNLNAFALFFSMGTGKTRTVIEILRYKMNLEKRVFRTIVFTPPIVCKNFRDEWLKFSKITPEQVTVLSGSAKAREILFLEKAYSDGDPQGHIFVLNYESLLMPDLFDAFSYWKPEALVFDESHRIKAHDAKRSKMAAVLANPRHRPAPYKYILTGSPVLNSPLDIFQQFRVLDGGATFGDNFFAFRNRYFYDANIRWKGTTQRYFPKWEVRPGAVDEINRLIFKSGARVEKKDCLDLPPLIRQIITVPLAPEQARIYKELAKQFISFVGERAVSAPLAIVKALRLMQIASGFVSLDGEDACIKQFETNHKIAALAELLSDLTPHTKVLVWAVWKENYKQIRALLEKMGVGYVEVHGEVSDKNKREAVEKFNTDEATRVFLGHPGSGGIGINLVAASVSIFYSRTFSLEHSLQAEARNHRGGSEIHEKITRIDLVSEGTIDQTVVERLHQKEEISADILKSIVASSLVG